MGVVMAKLPGMSPLPPGKPAAHVQNLTWESAHEPLFTLPDARASPGALHSGEIADWK